MNYYDFGLFAVLFSCSVAITVACDSDGILDCTKIYANKLPEVKKDIDTGDGSSDLACKWASDYIECLRPHLVGCSQDQLKKLEEAFIPFNKEPLNCNVDVTSQGVCDGSALAKCSQEYAAKTPDIGAVGNKNALVKATCKWAREYSGCMTQYSRGCAQKQKDALNDIFQVFNAEPFECDIVVGGNPAMTATVFIVVIAALLAILM